MKISTRHTQAATAAECWKRQYLNDDGTWRACSGDSQRIYMALVQLGDSPSPDDVDATIGNGSWTHPGICAECSQPSPAVVSFDNPRRYSTSACNVCPSCLRLAVEMVRETERAMPTDDEDVATIMALPEATRAAIARFVERSATRHCWPLVTATCFVDVAREIRGGGLGPDGRFVQWQRRAKSHE